jgi:hypothetical protein
MGRAEGGMRNQAGLMRKRGNIGFADELGMNLHRKERIDGQSNRLAGAMLLREDRGMHALLAERK